MSTHDRLLAAAGILTAVTATAIVATGCSDTNASDNPKTATDICRGFDPIKMDSYPNLPVAKSRLPNGQVIIVELPVQDSMAQKDLLCGAGTVTTIYSDGTGLDANGQPAAFASRSENLVTGLSETTTELVKKSNVSARISILFNKIERITAKDSGGTTTLQGSPYAVLECAKGPEETVVCETRLKAVQVRQKSWFQAMQWHLNR